MTLNSSQYGDARMATFPDISPQSFEVFTGSGGLNTHSAVVGRVSRRKSQSSAELEESVAGRVGRVGRVGYRKSWSVGERELVVDR